MDESSEKLLKERPDEPPPIEGSVSTTIDYSLRLRNTPPPSAGQLVAVAVAAAVYTILSWLSASLLSSIPDLLEAFDAGKIDTYYDVIRMSK